jgi:predicted transcriptional regulator
MANAPSTNVYIHCRVSQAMSASLQSIAKKEDRSVSYIMRQAFKEYLASRSIDAPLI